MVADRKSCSQAGPLAIVSDVFPQLRSGGDLMLFRLFADYPPENLFVAHSGYRRVSHTTLPHVSYRSVPTAALLQRGRRTRLAGLANLALAIRPTSTVRVQRALNNFTPAAVVTVAQDFLWLSAANWCLRKDVPLHLLIHDDWPEFLRVPQWARGVVDRIFARVLRQAASRLCIAPGMAAEYKLRYGCECNVLLPTRGSDSPEPRLRVPNAAFGRIIVGYLGGLPLSGYSRALRALADILQGIDGSLSLYGSHRPETIAAEGLDHPSILRQTELSRDLVFDHLMNNTSALFCPVSFLPEDATIMRMLFPSKLADYTACGLPIIIWGPEDSSAVMWARSHADAAFVCTDPMGAGIADFLQRLQSDQELAVRYAKGALAAGEKDFSLAEARARLTRAITAGNGATHAS